MKKTLLIFAVLFYSITHSAQVNDPSLNNRRFIEVTGTSESEITPDELYITITLLERNEKNEKLNIEKQEKELKENIKDLGIDLSNLTLSSADADYRRMRMFRKDVAVSKSYILKVNSADMLGKVYERLDKINVQDAYISRYTHSKILDYQKENRIKAVKAAKEKVDYLLGALGQQAGPPIQIMESDNYVQDGANPYMMRMAKNVAMMEDAGAGESEISFKKIKIRNSFMVKYEILVK